MGFQHSSRAGSTCKKRRPFYVYCLPYWVAGSIVGILKCMMSCNVILVLFYRGQLAIAICFSLKIFNHFPV